MMMETIAVKGLVRLVRLLMEVCCIAAALTALSAVCFGVLLMFSDISMHAMYEDMRAHPVKAARQ
jgi:hypothetical protein